MAWQYGSQIAYKGVLAGWGLFAGTHLIMSSDPFRASMRDMLGEKGFSSAYSAVSVATLAPTIYFYFLGRYRGPLIHQLAKSKFIWNTAIGLKGLALFLGMQTFSNPNPFKPGQHVEKALHDAVEHHDNHGSDHHHQEHVQARGLYRITRHPLFAAFATWGVACMLQRGYLIDQVFWGGFPLFYIVGSLHQDARMKRQGVPKELYEQTSLIPFGAVITGKQNLLVAADEMGYYSFFYNACVAGAILVIRQRWRYQFWSARRYTPW